MVILRVSLRQGRRGKREREGGEEEWRTVDARGKGKLKVLKEQTGDLPWLHEPQGTHLATYSVPSFCPSLIFPPCPSIPFHASHPPPPLSLMPAVSLTRATLLSLTSTARSKPPKLNWLRLWQTPAAPSSSSSANAQLWRRRFPALSHTCHLSGGFPLNSCVSFS
jgi:hypothetical protein